MRREREVEIDNKKIKVFELTVKDILEILGESGEKEGTQGSADQIEDLKSLVEKHLTKATDAKLEDFREMAPSDIKTVFDAFKEVNSVFFEMAQRAGLGAILEEVKSALLKDFSGIAAGLFKQATQKSGDTDSLSSS